MAYVVARPSERWEVRESHSTPAGPRSRTLATFRTLTSDVIAHAAARSAAPLDPGELRKAALRAGAPVADEPADRAASALLSALASGKAPRPVLRRLLLDALLDRPATTSDSVRAAARWSASSPRERGAALRDLLLLADHLPSAQTRAAGPRFPRVRSTHA